MTRTDVRDPVTEKEENNNENHGKHPVWGDHEEKTLEQVRTCAATADRAALMADGHLGYAVPIGGVVAYKDAISPSGVGFRYRLRQQGRSSRYAGRRAAREDRHHYGRCVGDVELRCWTKE
jgi:hypothetical protein